MMEVSVFNSCSVGNNQCTCFEKLSEQEKELINNNQVEIKFKKGEVICKQGAFASHVMYICDGLAKVFLEGRQGQESLILKIIPPGNLIGLTSIMIGNNVFQYSANAYMDSVIRMIDINVFRKLIRDNSNFASEIIDILSANTIQSYGRFFCLTQKQSYGRLADIILCLSERIFKEQKFELNLTRKELAELTGMSTESVIRMIKKLKEDDLIRITGKSFEITDYERLRTISEYG